jgi:hypothetical protein
MEVVPSFRSRIRIFTPRTSLLALHRQYTGGAERPYPCRGGIDFFFVRARDGHTFPCGYRGNEDMGAFGEEGNLTGKSAAPCRRCDWECFRDPSELFGPLLQGISDPVGLFRKFRKDREYFRLWREDLRYYKACEFFDGRKPPREHLLQPFQQDRAALPAETPFYALVPQWD